jgi:hypothetical protein
MSIVYFFGITESFVRRLTDNNAEPWRDNKSAIDERHFVDRGRQQEVDKTKNSELYNGRWCILRKKYLVNFFKNICFHLNKLTTM